MADGQQKPIEQIAIGDSVLATDPITGETRDESVVGTIIGAGNKIIVDVTVDATDGGSDGHATIQATGRHPFWVENRQEWVDAIALAVGDQLRTAAGSTVVVTKTTIHVERRTVYNLTVNALHTFYALAGRQPVLTHNDQPCLFAAHAEERAEALASQWHPRAEQARTISVLWVYGNGNRMFKIVATSYPRGLTDAQKASMLADEVYVPDDFMPGYHAEVRAINYARSKRWKAVVGGTSKNVCPDCEGFIDGQGGEVFPATKTKGGGNRMYAI